MATNPYFRVYEQASEQDLSHDLVEEVIQMAGMDVYYIKTESVSSPEFDVLFGENRFEKLRDCYQIEMYPRNIEMPFGGGDLFTKMGLSMNQQVTFEVAYRRFESVVGTRPREGDYIFLPALTPREMNDVFKVMYVETDDVEWNPQGTILKYVIKCERSSFSHQEIDTGIEGLDFSIPPELNLGKNDPNNDSDKIQELTEIFVDFDESHPFGRA